MYKDIGIIRKLRDWLPHELTERYIHRRKIICEFLLQRQKGKCFMHRFVIGDEIWIHYNNLKRKAALIKPDEPGASTPK